MSAPMAEHPDDALAAYALDALTAPERDVVEAHVVGCSTCERKVIELRRVRDVLPLAAPPATPPATLRTSILSAAAATPQAGIASTVAPRRTRTRLAQLQGWIAAAALLLISLGLGIWNLTLQGQVRQLQGQVAYEATLLATADAPGANGLFTVIPGAGQIVTVTNLAPPTAGQVYEAWVIGPGGPLPAGTFITGPDGRGAVELTRAAQQGEVIAVTSEVAPGTTSPKGKAVLQGKATSEPRTG